MKGNKGQFEIGAALIVLVIATIFVLFIGFDSVDASHLGVMVRLGQITGTMEPGIRWTGMLTHVYEYDMRIRKVQVDMLGDQSATDKGGQAVFGSISVNYRLKGDKDVVQRLYANVGRDDIIADRLNIEPIIREGFKQATVQYEAMEILQNRQQVKEIAKENIHNNFPQEYFDIVDITVQNIDFSPDFKKAIEEKKVASQNKLKEQENVGVVMYQQQQEIEKYKAEAQKMNLQRQVITSELNNQLMLQKWDGHLPEYLIITPGSQGMFLQLAQGQIQGSSHSAEAINLTGVN
jgi:regulator of protease activity HflC (stomatin/prohibitin superfamily)